MDKNIETILKKGGVGVYPTDTLYGLVGLASLKKTVEKIYEIKGRDEDKPFIILISKISDIENFGVKLSKEHVRFLNTVWPGKVSVILPVKGKKFEYLHRGKNSLAFRMPANKNQRGKSINENLLKLIKKTGSLVAPSANPQGLPPASNITEAKKYFGDQVQFYVSGGKKAGKPSRIISLLKGEPEILR